MHSRFHVFYLLKMPPEILDACFCLSIIFLLMALNLDWLDIVLRI